MTRTLTALVSLALALANATVHAQVRHRRPFAASIEVRYGFDNNTGSGCRDYNCGSRCYDGHSGTDFGIPTGTPVLASADGVVIATNNGCANTGYVGNPCGGRCGNYVQLEHADGSRSIFCHMQLNSLAVSRGQRVRCGQTLGRSASSGSSSGPHLHFGWRRTASGASIDSYRGRCTSSPGAWTDQRSYPLSPNDRCACTPSPEACNNVDDDCDGRIDDGLTRSCYTGPAGTAGRGVCRAGTQTCATGRWGSCAGQVLPRTETCNRTDDDCDGRVDDGVCVMDAGTRPDAATDVSVDRSDVRGDAPRDAAPDMSTVDVAAVDVVDDVAEDAVDDVAEDVADDAEFVDVGEAPDSNDVAPDRYDVPDDGCGCRTPGAPTTPTWPWWLFVVAITTRRRGPRRTPASCSSGATTTSRSND
jgi:MYXO-CTERM domain-containing protein